MLPAGLRKSLEDACTQGRRAAESGSRAALGGLGVAEDRPPGHLDDDARALRLGLRAKSRQLGDEMGSIELLVAECAFEQWHRLLFARFLAENQLLIHPQYLAPVTLAECDDLAESMSEPDGWAVAGRFAAEILPGIFRLGDPCVQLRLAPEARVKLEGIVEGLSQQVFTADDSLGWVYQYWQKERKDQVNASERKIGGADLGPVTQLFTENYMVRFLLENSLGAWWAARRPDSPLLKDMRFLRFDDRGAPAAGGFTEWPERVAEVTVMDPCCGSGHFLVEAFDMLWRMRAEEETLPPVAAQDAVLRDNLFGLELDPRCVQIAMFAVAIAAWKAGGRWRELPIPHIACSGIPVKAPVEEWTSLARGNERLENALVRLHILFRDADTLGSLIDPKRAVEVTDPTGLQRSFEDVEWDDVAPLLEQLLNSEDEDPGAAVLGADAAGIARAADHLSRKYTLIATNVPYLHRQFQDETLRSYLERVYFEARSDLAVAFIDRAREMAPSGSIACVTPENWTYLSSYRDFRRAALEAMSWHLIARLGPGAFAGIGGEVVKALLLIASTKGPGLELLTIDVSSATGVAEKAAELATSRGLAIGQDEQLKNPDHIVTFSALKRGPLLERHARGLQGLSTGDNARFVRFIWELPDHVVKEEAGWRYLQSAPTASAMYSGRQEVVRWGGESGATDRENLGAIRGRDGWGKRGVALSRAGSLPASLYTGELFVDSVAVVVPADQSLVPALWLYCSSDEYLNAVRQLNTKLIVSNATLVKVPFDVEYWRGIAAETFPAGFPEPSSDDVTQWLFPGSPRAANEPLQVAAGRLLGFRWPEQQESDDLDDLADRDGIVCLSSLRGEPPAVDRLLALLARAFGADWSPARVSDLLAASGSKKQDLESWLRDDFFKAHCQVFKNRPFIWQIWDGRKDGFSALVNYQKLDRAKLQVLAYTYLGDWIERQQAGVRDGVAGAEERLAAAQALQAKLELILEGEPPYDIYVRWKTLAEQPMGWEPDLNDGVRLNVRPFVQAGVLRSKFNVKWGVDRGKNPDGSVRDNDCHHSLAEKANARTGSG